MKALLMDCKKYKIKITSLAIRPGDVNPEKIKEKEQECNDCILAFITVEKEDPLERIVPKMAKQILDMAKENKRDNVTICPFAHLSNNLADSEISIKFFNLLKEKLSKKITTIRSHFGSDKDLSLELYGHQDAVRYRQFIRGKI